MNPTDKYQIKYQTKIEESIPELNSFANTHKSNQDQDDESCELKQGKWNDYENLNFVIFITANKQIFKSKQKRKSQRIFKALSNFISTRSPRQCRSHFQKAIKKFATIVKMRKHYQNLVGATQFEARLNQSMPIIKLAIDSKQKNTKTIEKVEVQVQTDPIFFPPFFGMQHQFFTPYSELLKNQFYWLQA